MKISFCELDKIGIAKRVFAVFLSMVLVLTMMVGSLPSVAQADSTTHGLGCVLVTPAQAAMMPQTITPRVSVPLPSSIDNSSEYPAPGNQGNQGSCTAWSVAYADKSMQEGLYHNNWSLATADHQFSPAYVYNQLDGGQDNGISIPDAMNLITNQGVCSLATMRYDPNDYTTQPTDAQKAEAQSYKGQSWAYLADGTGIQSIKEHLATNDGVVIQIPVYSDFYFSNGPNYYNENGTYEGGHAVCLVGYDDGRAMPDGSTGAFKFINSWGTNWGDKGYGYISYHVMSQDSYFMTWVMTNRARPDASVESESATITKTDAWTKVTGGSVSGGATERSTTPGSEMTFKVTGTEVDFIGTKNVGLGSFEVYVDGASIPTATFSNVGPALVYQVVLGSVSFAQGTHTIRVRTTTTTLVDIDRIDVYGSPASVSVWSGNADASVESESAVGLELS